MPDQTGLELIDRLLQHIPSLKVLMISGYTDEKSQWPYIKKRGIPFLQKPFTPADFFGMVRKLLE